MENWTQITDEKDLIGKTIERVCHIRTDDKYFFLYTDKTFSIITRWDYPDGGIKFGDESFKMSFSIHGYGNNDLVELGFRTQKELDVFNAPIKNETEAKKKAAEIEQLKRLKEKYPNI